MKILKKEYTKKDIFNISKKFFVILVANFLVAFGTGVFLVPVNICAGGLSGIAIIINQFSVLYNWGIEGNVDIIVTILTWSLMGLSLLFLGKKFTFKTLASSIFCPLFLILVYRVEAFQQISKQLVVNFTEHGELVSYLLCAVFGGGIIGAGVALSFSVGASTGGTDILAFLISKLFKKASMAVITFCVDGSIILIYVICFWNSDPSSNYFALCLMNILCALITSLVVEYLYVLRNKNLICEIISDDYQKINNYVQNELGRGSTIITCKGGYQLQERNIIRVVISTDEYNDFYDELKILDPKCFVTFTMSKSVIGNGFEFQEGDEPLFKTIQRQVVVKKKSNKVIDKENSNGKNKQ